MSATSKLTLTPIPVDRVARRVVSAARPEDVWQPMPKPVAEMAFSREMLPIRDLPLAAPTTVRGLEGRRRDRMTIVGYAAQQGSARKSAKWVVRCDCGNYEQRSSILRWLGTQAADKCAECRNREFKKGGNYWPDAEPAHRLTKTGTTPSKAKP